jgi:hypothetical protein
MRSVNVKVAHARRKGIAVVFLNLDVSVLRKHVNVVQTVNVAIIAHVEAIAVAVKLFINLHFF